MKVYFIEAHKSYLSYSWTLSYTLDEKEAKSCVEKIETLNDQSVADYYVVESDKDITGYVNGNGDHFVFLVRVRYCGTDKTVRAGVFDSLEEAEKFLNSAKDDQHYCTMDYIMLASERKSWKSGKYANW